MLFHPAFGVRQLDRARRRSRSRGQRRIRDWIAFGAHNVTCQILPPVFALATGCPLVVGKSKTLRSYSPSQDFQIRGEGSSGSVCRAATNPPASSGRNERGESPNLLALWAALFGTAGLSAKISTTHNFCKARLHPPTNHSTMHQRSTRQILKL